MVQTSLTCNVELVAVISRATVLILACFAGFYCFYLGHRLYSEGVASKVSGSFKGKGYSFALTAVGPGVFLAVLGTSIFVYVIGSSLHLRHVATESSHLLPNTDPATAQRPTDPAPIEPVARGRASVPQTSARLPETCPCSDGSRNQLPKALPPKSDQEQVVKESHRADDLNFVGGGPLTPPRIDSAIDEAIKLIKDELARSNITLNRRRSLLHAEETLEAMKDTSQ